MGLFKREKEEEEEYEDELQDRKLTRKFKDLNPENKKRRKEPPKPWGKAERSIVLIFFLITTLLAAGMLLFSYKFKFISFPEISLGRLNVKNPFGEEIIQVGNKGTFDSENSIK